MREFSRLGNYKLSAWQPLRLINTTTHIVNVTCLSTFAMSTSGTFLSSNYCCNCFVSGGRCPFTWLQKTPTRLSHWSLRCCIFWNFQMAFSIVDRHCLGQCIAMVISVVSMGGQRSPLKHSDHVFRQFSCSGRSPEGAEWMWRIVTLYSMPVDSNQGAPN